MRKRKLYLTEFLKRNVLNSTKVRLYFGNEYYDYNDFDSVIIYYRTLHKEEEIISWTYNEYFGYIFNCKK